MFKNPKQWLIFALIALALFFFVLVKVVKEADKKAQGLKQSSIFYYLIKNS